MQQFIFELKEVSKAYEVRAGIFKAGAGFKALDNVSLGLRRGVFSGIVGQSGSGKSTLARLLVGLVAPSSGAVLFEGRDLNQILKENRPGFHRKVQMIFQNPYLSLDPRWKIREILEEGIRELGFAEKRKRIEESLDRVRLKREYLLRRPQKLSGGERQRVAIARALVMQPEYLILDEPTSQLDVTIQAEITKLLKDLAPVFCGGILFITHDLALASHLVEEVFVFDEGRLVESGAAANIFRTPTHEKTRRLLEAVLPMP